MVTTTALGYTSGVYSLFVGVAIIGLWIMLILKKEIPEIKDEPITIYFHITAEMFMGVLATVSGILLIIDLPWAPFLFIISSGLCMYAVVNSAGYYAQRKTWVFVILFAAIFTISVVLSIFQIINLL
ncbi:MAG: hypothetical protein FK734_02600 [Asgard group archaeon]|nr:hypothetical protein [Asgard group archaeon]